jgi:hypothetical protein
LIDAYLKTGNSAYLTAAENAADFMMANNTPSTGGFWYGFYGHSWHSACDYDFLMQLSAVTANPAYQIYAIAAWGWQKPNGNLNDGGGYIYSSPSLYWLDDLNNWVGIGYYGIASWDASYWGLTALEMHDTAWATAMASIIHANMADIALPMTGTYLTNNYTNDYVNMGMAEALKFLVTIGGYAGDVATLKSQLESNQISDGSWDFQSATPGNGESQTTAYCVMGLLAASDYSHARAGADWLVTNQLPNGGWEGSPDEYSEVDSEALQALTASVVQLTVVSAYDSPIPSGTTWHVVGDPVTASVTSPAGSGGNVYHCSGWTGTGSVPASGTATTVTFTINVDSTLTWNWQYYSVGGSWAPIPMQALAPISTLTLLAPWIVLGLVAAASAIATYRRLFKKHW